MNLFSEIRENFQGFKLKKISLCSCIGIEILSSLCQFLAVCAVTSLIMKFIEFSLIFFLVWESFVILACVWWS